MANFNLLPWREKAREDQKQQFFVGMGVAVGIAAVMIFIGHLYVQSDVENQENRNQYLQSETKILERKITEIKNLDETRQALLDRIKVIEELQSTRPAIVHLLDEMVGLLPKGMYLTRIQQKNTQIGLEGKAESNARVSSYMNKLNASPWLKSSNLKIISAEKREGDGFRLRDFRLVVTQLLQASEQKKQEAKQ